MRKPLLDPGLSSPLPEEELDAKAVAADSSESDLSVVESESPESGLSVVESPESELSTTGSPGEELFPRAFRIHYRGVYYFFLKRGFSPQQSEDLVQETFFKAFRNLGSVREWGALEGWLYRIADNLRKNEHRSRCTLKRKHQEVPLEEASEPQLAAVAGAGPGGGGVPAAGEQLDGLLADERVRLLREALDDLPPQMQRCVKMNVAQGLSYRQIAAAMQISIETVKAHLYQARQLLKTRLADYYDRFDD